MNNENKYKFIAKMALEFRLSLENVCKILGWEPTEENKMKFYNFIKEHYGFDRDEITKYNYLFFYETNNETEKASKISFFAASNFLNRYIKALKNEDYDKAKLIEKELFKTENDFKEISKEIPKGTITQEMAEIITKYRIKHVISKIRFCQDFGVSRTTLARRENEIESNILREKNERLSDFFKDIADPKKFSTNSSSKRIK